MSVKGGIMVPPSSADHTGGGKRQRKGNTDND